MEIEPITSIGGTQTAGPSQAEQAYAAQAQPSVPAADEAKANELATVEQLAANGDPLAVIDLAHAQQRLTPIDAQLLFPAPAGHAAGAHEAGKGDLIDVYD
jgi:hypothetical protein